MADLDFSFEDLTFGDEDSKLKRGENASQIRSELEPLDTDLESTLEEENVILVSTSYGGKIPLNFEMTLSLLRDKCGSASIKTQNFRDKQSFAFIQFADAESTEKALQVLNESQQDGHKLNAEVCKTITPGRDPRTHNFNSDYKTATLVMKNLPFQLKQDKLEEILIGYGYKAQSVSYLYDASGMFRGMAFVKYKEVEHAAKVFELMNNLDIQGRKVRIEYKRKVMVEGEPIQQDDANKLYEQLFQFRANPSTPEVAFPCSSSFQRKQLHQIAEKLGLGHYSTGEGHVIVKKKDENVNATNGKGEPIKQPRKRSESQKGQQTRSYDARMSPEDSRYGSYDRKSSRSYGQSPHYFRSPPSSYGASSYGTSPRNITLQRVLPEEPLVSPSRQPKGPDGTHGFTQEYRSQRAASEQKA